MRQRFGAALCAMVLGISAGAYAAGETPGNPISLEVGASAEGETSRAAFYRVTPSRSGMLVVSLAPEGADLDLAVMGPGGNPTVESRRGGMEAEEATLQATAGTEYIVRVTSAAGRFGVIKHQFLAFPSVARALSMNRSSVTFFRSIGLS